jgi:glycosyltransferase involved in cell wall biosynthesis
VSGSKPVRIAVYTDAVDRGGAEVSLRTLLAALDPRLEVTAVGVDAGVLRWIAEARPGMETFVLPAVRDKRHLRPILSHLHEIRRLRPDVFHANLRHPWSCQYGLAAAILTPGTRAVAVEHALIPASGPLQRRLRRLTTRRLAAHVTVGRRAAQAFEELLGLRKDSMRVIYTGVRLADAAPAARPPGGLVIGYLGRFSPEKALDVLLEALARLDDVTAVLVGDGPERARLERQAAELGIADRIVLPGWQEDSTSYLRSFDVLVSPSRSETGPLAVLEAMLAAVPVVATNVGIASEALVDGETGLLVEPDDPDALAAAIRTAQADPELRRRLAEEGREVAARSFTPEAMAEAFEKLYAELVAGPEGASEQAEATPA